MLQRWINNIHKGKFSLDVIDLASPIGFNGEVFKLLRFAEKMGAGAVVSFIIKHGDEAAEMAVKHGDEVIESGSDVINKLDDVLSSKTLTNQTKKVDNYVSSIKGNAAAKADFDAMNPTNIRTYANGTIAGDLPDGRTINIHPSTTLGGTPSVEIYDPVTGKSIKIRY